MVEVQDEIFHTTLDDEFDRKKKYTNSCGFTDDVLRRRDLEMKELIKAYPNICPAWLELAWNFTEYTPKEEQDRIIKEKLWEGKPKHKRQTGGTITNAIRILTADGEEKISEDASGN